ncbi:DUF5047 domain-containing protein [Kitasatospora sp. MBT66]|uniref:DUF5047 domain-containing protein n=1 Tax=Kitasatospora sp. MBT66 TaxID=1444769 RepID=UPI0005BAA999|nr:DUF5047 domain-containing protein [Kitasatospora sp. MBT66]
MYAVSPRFLAALSNPHQVVTRIDAYLGGTLTAADLPHEGGSVTVDRGSKVRRQLALTIPDPGYLPWNPGDPLGVYGQQLVVQRGIRYPDGTTELVPLGTFRIDEPAGDPALGPVTVTGQSAEASVQDDRFTAPVSTSSYASTVTAITALIRETLPDAPVVNLTAGARDQSVAPITWDAQADRWDAVTQLATSMRAECYADATGRFVITDLPDLSTATPVWDVTEGPTGNLIKVSRKLARAGVYNAVIARGETSAGAGGPAVSGAAYDTDPTSPTRWGGPYGRVPRFYSSGLLTTTAACEAVAAALLRDATAPNVQTSLSSLPNPALEGADCLRLTYGGRHELVLVQSFTVPLDVDGDFAITLRASKEVTTG